MSPFQSISGLTLVCSIDNKTRKKSLVVQQTACLASIEAPRGQLTFPIILVDGYDCDVYESPWMEFHGKPLVDSNGADNWQWKSSNQNISKPCLEG